MKKDGQTVRIKDTQEGEDIEVIETTLAEAAAMIAVGEIIDAKTVILVQFLRERAGA